jgi:pimeloyl-ACP methyl ester carboxylesterase
MRTVEEEAAGLHHAAGTLCRAYRKVSVPVHLIAGSDDRIVDTQKHTARLHQELIHSTFHCVPGRGHMVHHAAPEKVLSAIDSINWDCQRTSRAEASDNTRGRHWLHIGENLAAA